MADITPRSTAQLDPNFEKRLRDHKDHAAAEAEARIAGWQVPWARPTGWNGDVFDSAGMHAPFNRDVANQQFVQATADPEKSGTTGDMVATTMMVDRLAVAERAFRVRHTMGRIRAMALTIARRKGHGNDSGTFIQLGVEYLRRIIRQAKA